MTLKDFSAHIEAISSNLSIDQRKRMIGEFTIPLIGVAKQATDQVCYKCKQERHITQIHFNGKNYICFACINKKPKRKVNELRKI